MAILRTTDELREATVMPTPEAERFMKEELSEFFQYELHHTFPGKSVIKVFSQGGKEIGFYEAVRSDIKEIA
jgi:hypothetical protein